MMQTWVFIGSDRVVAGFGLEGDPAQLGERVDTGLAAEPAVARGLDPAEWHLRLVRHGRGVDVANARMDLPRDLDPARRVAGEYRRRQAVFGVIGKLDRMGLVARADDSDDRAETLVAEQLHVRRDPIHEMRRH